MAYSTSGKKQLILSAFMHQAPAHLNPGLFNFPGDQGRQYQDLKHLIALAQKLEAAKFHCIFFADVLAGYDVYKQKLDPSIEAGAQYVQFLEQSHSVHRKANTAVLQVPEQ